MEKNMKILTWLLVGSLILNVLMYNRMGNQIEQEMRNQNHHIQHSMDIFHSDINGITKKINDIHEENKWILSEEFIPNQQESTPEEIHMFLDWSFRELERDAEVFLLYREENRGDWIEVPAESTGGTSFRAPMTVTPDNRYQYHVLSKGEIDRTGEMKHVPTRYYHPVPLVSRGMGRSSSNGRLQSFNVEMAQHGPVLFDFFKVKSVTAQIHYENQPMEEIELQKVVHSQKEEAWELVLNELDGSLQSVVIRTEYIDGRVHEGEIFPDESKYMRDIGMNK